MFKQNLENKTQMLEQAYERCVIDLGDINVVFTDAPHGEIPSLDKAAFDFVRAVRFVGSLTEPCIDVEPYKRRVGKLKAIKLNYTA